MHLVRTSPVIKPDAVRQKYAAKIATIYGASLAQRLLGAPAFAKAVDGLVQQDLSEPMACMMTDVRYERLAAVLARVVARSDMLPNQLRMDLFERSVYSTWTSSSIPFLDLGERS
jgi:hypothetical protein